MRGIEMKIAFHYYLFAMKIIYICSSIYESIVMNYDGG